MTSSRILYIFILKQSACDKSWCCVTFTGWVDDELPLPDDVEATSRKATKSRMEMLSDRLLNVELRNFSVPGKYIHGTSLNAKYKIKHDPRSY